MSIAEVDSSTTPSLVSDNRLVIAVIANVVDESVIKTSERIVGCCVVGEYDGNSVGV